MRYTVEVMPEEAGEPNTYEVEADSERDACVIAFLLDGGWNIESKEEGDADTLPALALMYAQIKR